MIGVVTGKGPGVKKATKADSVGKEGGLDLLGYFQGLWEKLGRLLGGWGVNIRSSGQGTRKGKAQSRRNFARDLHAQVLDFFANIGRGAQTLAK